MRLSTGALVTVIWAGIASAVFWMPSSLLNPANEKPASIGLKIVLAVIFGLPIGAMFAHRTRGLRTETARAVGEPPRRAHHGDGPSTIRELS